VYPLAPQERLASLRKAIANGGKWFLQHPYST
jgi:hypothetical protein